MVSPSIASATDRTSITWRTVARLVLMVLTLLFLIVPHLLYRAARRPSPMVMAFLNAAGWITGLRSEEHTSELQSLMRISYAVFCLKKNNLYTHKPKNKLNTKQNNKHKP